MQQFWKKSWKSTIDLEGTAITTAIIDLGSNSVRMDIVRICPDGEFETLHQIKQTVRLSEGMGEEKLLRPEAVGRTVKAMKELKSSIEQFGADKIIPIATAAMRQAKNPELLTQELERETGITLDIISGEREAYYDFLGVKATVNMEDFLAIDTGGASTEFILCRNGQLKNMVSLPIGAVNLTEKFFPQGEGNKEGFVQAQEYICRMLGEQGWLDDARFLPLVGMGGTARAIATIHMKTLGFSGERVHGHKMDKNTVNEIVNRILTTPKAQRDSIAGLQKDRQDIITGGAMPLVAALEFLNAASLTACEYGLRTGVLAQLYRECTGREFIATEDLKP